MWEADGALGGHLLDIESGTVRENLALRRVRQAYIHNLRLRKPIMDGFRRFGLHPPQEETQPDDQDMVDCTSCTDTLFGKIGKPDRGRTRDEITGNDPGYVSDNVSIPSANLSLDLGAMWRQGCPKSPDWDSDGDSDIDERAEEEEGSEYDMWNARVGGPLWSSLRARHRPSYAPDSRKVECSRVAWALHRTLPFFPQRRKMR